MRPRRLLNAWRPIARSLRLRPGQRRGAILVLNTALFAMLIVLCALSFGTRRMDQAQHEWQRGVEVDTVAEVGAP